MKKGFNKALIVLALIPLIIISVSLAYYLVVFLPEKERLKHQSEIEKIRSEEQANERNAKQLDDCFEKARVNYRENWDLRVKNLRGTPTTSAAAVEEIDNTLPVYLAEPLYEKYSKDQELCVKKYK